jgi:hypothetical protein
MKIKLLTILFALGLNLVTTAQFYGYPNVSLWNIQYSPVDSVGATPNSAYMYQYVNTGGIITAKYGYGYYVQTTNATEWAAINVYDRTYNPVVGDSVTFTGKVIEFHNETEIDSLSNFKIVSHNNQALTPPTLVAFDSIQRRKYQGMLVKIKDATCLWYNLAQAWYAFSDSTMTKAINSEDTVDNVVFIKQSYTPGKRYNITGCIHFEYANWVEPRNIKDIDSINVTGINEVSDNSAGITVYPNPSNGVFTIEPSVDSRQSLVNVYTVLGKKVYSEFTIHNGVFTIDISSLAKGLYFLQISNSRYNTVKKIIIE